MSGRREGAMSEMRPHAVGMASANAIPSRESEGGPMASEIKLLSGEYLI
jgi:hypothetical protein